MTGTCRPSPTGRFSGFNLWSDKLIDFHFLVQSFVASSRACTHLIPTLPFNLNLIPVFGLPQIHHKRDKDPACPTMSHII